MPTKDQIAGVQYGDKVWDQILRFRGDEFFIAFLTRLMAFYGAATTLDQTIRVLDAVRTGVVSLQIMAEKSKDSKPS